MKQTETQQLQEYVDEIYGAGAYRIEYEPFVGFSAVSLRDDTPPHSQFLGETAAHAHAHLDGIADLLRDREEGLHRLAEVVGIPYDTLVKAAREGRLEARRSGTPWLSTRRAVEEAIEAGGMKGRSEDPDRDWRMDTGDRVAQVAWLDAEAADLMQGYDPADYGRTEALDIAHGLYRWWRRETDLPTWFDDADKVYMIRALEAQITD